MQIGFQYICAILRKGKNGFIRELCTFVEFELQYDI